MNIDFYATFFSFKEFKTHKKSFKIIYKDYIPGSAAELCMINFLSLILMNETQIMIP
jgi:hypothetical protein